MKVGFTGSRNGLSIKQQDALVNLLLELLPTEIHHGDCVGSDCDFVFIASSLPEVVKKNPQIIAYPGRSAGGSEEQRGHSPYNTVTHPVEHYFVRNQKIVDNVDLLIGCPSEMKRQATGGTWYTIFYAEKMNKPLIIVWRDGKVEKFYQENLHEFGN